MAEPPFRHVAIVGTGLIGGSFGLALRKHHPSIPIRGWDRPEVLDRALQLGAISEPSKTIPEAIHGADLVYIALPIGATIEFLPLIAGSIAPLALVTDACSTKTAICRAALEAFREGAKFLGGHPIAGKEVSGIENASADLFKGTRYVLVTDPTRSNEDRVAGFAALVREFGAEPAFYDAETHDWAVGVVSHLPQLVAVALARVVLDETDETGLPTSLAGTGLRDTLRLAGSPYDVWRDICLTNTENVSRALDRVMQALDHLRTRLTSKDLQAEFQAANELYKILHQLQ